MSGSGSVKQSEDTHRSRGRSGARPGPGHRSESNIVTLHTRARPLAMSGPGPPQISQLIESVTGTPRGSKKRHCGDKNELYWWIRRKHNETETKTMRKSHYFRSYTTQFFQFLLLKRSSFVPFFRDKKIFDFLFPVVSGYSVIIRVIVFLTLIELLIIFPVCI